METDPTFGPRFVGRDDILQTLEKRVQALLSGYRQNVGLLGARTVGKSSILHHFLSGLSDPSLLPVYVEVVPEPLDYFAQRFMGSLLSSVAEAPSGDGRMDFNAWIKRGRLIIPKTLRKMREVKRLLSESHASTAFRELWSLTQVIHEETGKKVILVLDDFDELESVGLENPFHEFGNAVMMQKDTLYLVGASTIQRGSRIFREKFSLLFGNFEVIEVKPFDFSTAELFLNNRLPGVQCAGDLKKFLVELTDGHPYFLDLLTDRFYSLLERRGANVLDEGVMLDGLESELFERRGRLHQYFLLWLHQIGKGRAFSLALKVLVAISLGYKKIHRIASFLERKQIEVKKILTRLLEEELVEKKGSFFSIRYPLLRFWMRYVYLLRSFEFMGAWGASVRRFREEVGALIHRRAEEETKELTKRVEELFREFQNDVVEIERKKVRCPHFTEVLFKPTNGRVFPVEARSGTTRWVCQVAYQKVTEEDVRSFVHDLERLRRKVQRRIMITLQGIDLNATLLAKEAKILLWRLKDFNELLDLYDRPKVIA